MSAPRAGLQRLRSVARGGAVAAGAAVAAYGAHAAAAWARYGHARPERRPRDELLDRFLPHPEVDEYHAVRVRAPAATTFAVAREVDLQRSPVARAIFLLRALPAIARGAPLPPREPRGLLAETLALGWGVLAEVPGREVVVGAYAQPWHQEVTFHPLPPEGFAAFGEPGYAKIAWTLAAEPLGPGESRFVTRTRVVTTDPESRRRFRRYWAATSAGIALIRYASLPLVKREAERRAGRAARRRREARAT